MDDTTHLTNDQSIKLFIQRDYSEGTGVKFQERFPSELQGRIDRDEFIGILRGINDIFADAEALSYKAFMENCCACLTGYLLLLCMSTHYEKCVKRAAEYIAEKNFNDLNRRGIFIIDPMEKGLRCIEVCISNVHR
ncbi:unnamed protein product [Rotaria socialis]|uniref:Ras modification protein ERF4 n=1 Tax=Rotaria socialis TaxID=392032 RepID=A0A818Q5S7_9BILA|nr:unnamed protein product [Rotaria socialis]CAF3534830.1 unnamed protein product [Rotaria socialis]CAF3636229.1 unnamed protein product [Rotaria socialis]CAF3715119.1 unnamed protein product [Rotaria socialis]CAF3740787.1 unnamed protein product [Rotaria socialis]